MKLHLGCSDDLKPGFLNVDRTENHVAERDGLYMQTDLNSPWPFEDSSVDFILAQDVFEHIHNFRPGNLGKLHCMNEAHRVLKPGGILDMTVPHFILADGSVNPGAVADPTHCTWWTWDDQFYFSEQFNSARVDGTYGGAIEQGERYRLGPSYGITARFRFPQLRQLAKGTWVAEPNHSGLVWKVREDAYGARTKLLGRIEAVK